MSKHFSFDGETYETHNTEQEARKVAESAMEYWSDAAGDGWDELSTQVCYGVITHAVAIERIEATADDMHSLPNGATYWENHTLEEIPSLIAAAPELLAELKRCLAWHESRKEEWDNRKFCQSHVLDHSYQIVNITAAITKAEGASNAEV